MPLFFLLTHQVEIALGTYSWRCGFPLECDWITKVHTFRTNDSFFPSSYQLPIAPKLEVRLCAYSSLCTGIVSGLNLCRFWHLITTENIVVSNLLLITNIKSKAIFHRECTPTLVPATKDRRWNLCIQTPFWEWNSRSSTFLTSTLYFNYSSTSKEPSLFKTQRPR